MRSNKRNASCTIISWRLRAMNNENSGICIYNPRIAKDLIQQRRFELKDIEPNKQDFKRTIFIFRNTQELKQYLDKVHKININ